MWARAASSPAARPANTPELANAAVVDVGSNSVRLVIYRLDGRAIWTVYNEKVLAGLGRDLGRTRLLSPAGVDQALGALRRFRSLVGSESDTMIFAAATAAVRDAGDGPAFAARVLKETGFKLRVLTGEEEARYSALGVAAGAPEASGIVGDLGGASLELTPIDNGVPDRGVTYPVGPFVFDEMSPEDLHAEIDKRLDGAEVFASDTFHAVGGAWRNLALIHMRMSNYPLEIVHQYRISATDALETARFVARQSRGSLERMGGASKKRAETLPHAAAVMAALVEKLKVNEVVFSAFGLREGLLFEAMGADVRARDPLIEGLAALGGRWSESEALGEALERWITPAFLPLAPVFDDQRDGVMIAAACRLAELGARLHPDQRATLAFEQVLRAPVAGQTHAERAFLAAAVFARYTAIADPPEEHILSRLLTFEAQRRAKALGAAIRLGCDLCGRNPGLLEKTLLSIDDETLTLTTRTPDLLLGAQTQRRAQTLADALWRKLVIEGLH